MVVRSSYNIVNIFIITWDIDTKQRKQQVLIITFTLNLLMFLKKWTETHELTDK